jgi:hypothetical protein
VNHGSKANSNATRRAAPAQHPLMPSSHVAQQWSMATAVVLAYVALEWISFIHEFKGLPLTPWNPGIGLAFACLMLAGPHYGIVLFAGVIVAEIVVLRSDLEWPIILGIGAIVASGYTFVATATRKQFRLDVGLIHLRDVVILLLAAFVGSTVITLLLAAVLLAGGELDFGDMVSLSPPRSCCGSPGSGASTRSICLSRGYPNLPCLSSSSSSRFG